MSKVRHYNTEDIDRWIGTARQWVRASGGIPPSLWETFEHMVRRDQRLSIYAHKKITRYPRLKKALLAMQVMLEDPGADESGQLPGDQKVRLHIQPVDPDFFVRTFQ